MAQTSIHAAQSAFPLPDVFSSALVEIFERVQPGIVQVHTDGRGGGTGVIWHEDGRIITNNHVVARDDARVQVVLVDGRVLEARVLHRNPRLDLALLQATGDNLKALPVGESARLRVGEWVFAIGHPWGQRWVVTAGIVSAMSSVKIDDDLTMKYIKSDVLLAPGNSGGPLLNADGKVVGINAMILGGDLSVSIPEQVVSTWLAGLPGRQVTLGVEIQTLELPASVRQTMQSQQAAGVLVVGIRPERSSQHNDLFIGDTILSVAGKPVTDTGPLRQALVENEERKTISLTILRGGKVITTDVATLMVERSS